MNLSKTGMPVIDFTPVHKGLIIQRALYPERLSDDGNSIMFSSTYHTGTHFKLRLNGTMAPISEQSIRIDIATYNNIKELVDNKRGFLSDYYHRKMKTKERWFNRKLQRNLAIKQDITKKVKI